MLDYREAGGHGGDLQAVAIEFGVQPEDFCDFSSNINPLGPPPGLFKELQNNLLSDLCRYPVPQARVFRSALAAFLEVPVERLLIGNGANELIHLLFLWARPQRVIIPFPTFSEYERAAKLTGAEVRKFPLPLETTSLKTDKIKELLNWGDFLVFCNPNNPTGLFYAPEKILEIIREAAKKGITVLVDESFFFFTGRSLKEALLGRDYPNLWTVVSLTKLWALPGLRLGFLAGPGEKIKMLTHWGDPWRVNALAQRAGIFCLTQREYLNSSLEMIREEREYLLKNLREIKGLKVFPGEANYLLLKGEGENFSSTALFRFLAVRGILIRNAANFSGLDQRFFRIAVRQREDNQRLLKELGNYFLPEGKG
ncbi:MAG: threonine-phosphate decarboxylase CobD [Dethiobacteria bacterium]|jgi:threonine-phosphate decarboxylase